MSWHPSLLDVLSNFHAHFESSYSSVSIKPTLPLGELLMSAQDVSWALHKINPCKAVGPDISSSEN